jgi:arsenate reductase
MSAIQPFTVLFLCTGNSARSIFGEFLLRQLGRDDFETHSAGSHPRGAVHPCTLRVLREVYAIDPSSARSKPVTGYQGRDFDFVITVCDQAQESCPIWPGRTLVAHWSSPDPAAFQGGEAETLAYFQKVAAQIHRRAERMCSLPLRTWDRERCRQGLQEIGELE